MRAGQLRRRVTLQQQEETADGQGGTTSTWADVRSFWAEILTTGGRELQRARQTSPLLTHEVRCRYRSGITADMRLVHHSDGEDLVLSVAAPPRDPDGRRRELILLCEEIAGEVAV